MKNSDLLDLLSRLKTIGDLHVRKDIREAYRKAHEELIKLIDKERDPRTDPGL